MAIFNSYVSLPEGTWCDVWILTSCSARPFEILSPDGVDPDSLRMLAITTDKARWETGIEAQHMAVCQNLVPLVNIKIAGKWMFIPLKMVLIGIDPYPYYNMSVTSATVSRISHGYLMAWYSCCWAWCAQSTYYVCLTRTRTTSQTCMLLPGWGHPAMDPEIDNAARAHII